MTISFGIEHIICEVPPQRMTVAELARQAGLDQAYVTRLHDNGLRSVPVSGDEPLSCLIQRAVYRMMERQPDLPKRTGGILLAHSLPAVAPDGVPFLHDSLAECGLELVPQIAVSGQPCSILHWAMRLTRAWLSSLPDQGILLIGADKVYAADDRIFFGSAMGDAVVVLFISARATRNRVLGTASLSHILAPQGEDSPQDAIARFRQENPHRIRQAILRCLANGGLELRHLDWIVPHTPYHLIWDLVAELLRFPRERILTDYLSETGHLNSNDVMVHYERALREGKISPAQNVLLVSPGFGGTRGCTLLHV